MNEAGVGYLPPDLARRRHSGSVCRVEHDLGAAHVDAGMLLDPGAELKDVEEFIRALAIKTPGAGAPASALSGGNQEKVLLARWLMRNAKVLVLDNPTNGVDAGAKEEIYGVLRSIATQGVGVLLVSDDLPEIIGLSNRILVMRGGTIA
jgi:ribose transport system ATP-binding protein